MNMKYALRSEDTEQINVISWANWNMNRYPELRWLPICPNTFTSSTKKASNTVKTISPTTIPIPVNIMLNMLISSPPLMRDY